MLSNVLSALAVLLLIGAAFGAAGVWTRDRFGPSAILPLWLGLPLALGAAGSVRSASVSGGLSYRPAQEHPAWMFLLFAVFLMLILAPGAVVIARGRGRTLRAGAIHSALLVLPGIVIAILVGLALELGGVDFMPPK